jgi:hypothetical protein
MSAVSREVRMAGPKDPCVVLSYFPPPEELLHGMFKPRAWFYGDRERPISGCIGGGVFVAGGSEFEAAFEYQ